MVALLSTAAAIILATGAEWIHRGRVSRIAPLAFGPGGPRAWTAMAPVLRVVGIGLMTWGLVTLVGLKPKVHRAKVLAEGEYRHVILVLDVSPSMRLVDSGPEGDQSRMHRAASIMESFFRRVVMEKVRLSVVATYTGAKPVVVDTSDINVVRNILGDHSSNPPVEGMPLEHAFEVGETQLFSGLEEAALLAKDWKAGSATLILISDGDTVPAQGMPKMPPSVSESLVVGVGNPKVGSFIDGRQSRQDAGTLRQIAVRIRGEYHDGNSKHIRTEMLDKLTHVETESILEKLSIREIALLSVATGAFLLAALPILLHFLGIRRHTGPLLARKPG